MSQTLLEIVQDLLSDMTSDEVNSITDTVESEQVARVVRRVYLDMIEEMDLPSKGNIVLLEDAATTDLPTRLKIPDTVSRIDWIRYADLQGTLLDEKHYRKVAYKAPEVFINLVASRNPTQSDIQVVTYSTGIELPIFTDAQPNYWTAFDDKYVWFDSWDSADTSTIVANHSMCFAYTSPAFSLADASTVTLPDNLLPYLYAKAKAVCFSDINRSVNPKAEQTENRLRIRAQRNKWRRGRLNIEGPNYGKQR